MKDVKKLKSEAEQKIKDILFQLSDDLTRFDMSCDVEIDTVRDQYMGIDNKEVFIIVSIGLK